MPKRYIVTGAAGHLGGTILRLLRKWDNEAVGLLLPSERPVVKGDNIRYVHGDVRQVDTLRPLFEGARGGDTAVIHTAGFISISAELPAQLRAVNVDGTKNMLRLSREYRVGRFVYTSSVHAIPELPASQLIWEVERFPPNWWKAATPRPRRRRPSW